MFSNFLIWEGDMAAAGVEACGMFSPTHLIVTAICLCLVALAVWASRRITEAALCRIVFYIAILVTVWECAKIIFNWSHGGWTPNNWLPLTFCSFSTYSYYCIVFGRGRLREAGKGFIAGGGIIAGLTFLVVPMTSVATYPMFHLLSCYSMVYHSLMMYVGLTIVVRGFFTFSMQGYRQFLQFTLPACFVALVINLIYGLFDDTANCNMMFLSNPYRLVNVPVVGGLIGAVYNTLPALYTLGVLAVYLTIPFFLPYGIAKLISLLRKKKA